MKMVTIEPVTRLEGHAKVTIHLDDAGKVADARFHVTEFRGFERFCVGRPMWEMPGITSRICGICPVSHLLASAKAGDRILAVEIPPAASKLRRLMNYGQILQSHALSFFHLSAPDLLFGFDSDPAKRNVFGIMASDPDLARRGIRLRQFGQEIIGILGGKKIHPSWAVPGGVRTSLTDEGRSRISGWLPELQETTSIALDLFKGWLDRYREEAECFGNFDSLFMGLVDHEGNWETYDGKLRFCDAKGSIVADGIDPARFKDFIGEAVEPWSYLKFPYFIPRGYPDGMYRVGPLARLNIAGRMGVPKADLELKNFRSVAGGTATSSFLYHYARLIEVQASLEKIAELLDDPDITSTRVRAEAGINCLEGVGVSEAPRGTLFHHYKVDTHGLIESVNLIIATGQNNLAMNRTVRQIAECYIKEPHIPEGILNRIEAGVRAYDPCLSCSTHAFGKMPMKVSLLDAGGNVLDEAQRTGG
jgi:NAD-reducing hydrogenase large subunit